MKSQYYQKLARDVDDLYRDISKNDAVANIKKFYGMLKSFLARKLSEMDDLVPVWRVGPAWVASLWEEVKGLEVAQLVRIRVDEMMAKISWLVEYTNLDETIQEILVLLYTQGSNLYSQTVLQASARHQSAKTKFIFDSDKGIISLEQKLPMPMAAFNETPDFQRLPEYESFTKWQEVLRSSKSSLARIVQEQWWRSMGGPYAWLPPFDGHAMIVFPEYISTFDGLSFKLGLPSAIMGSCSYVLVADLVDANFSVALEVQRSQNKTIHNIFVTAGHNTIVIDLEQKGLRDPKRGNQLLNLPLQTPNLRAFLQDMELVVQSPKGVTVSCHILHHICQFHVSGWYSRKVGGLLGTMDEEHSTDRTASSGRRDLDLVDVVNSWQFGDDTTVASTCNARLSPSLVVVREEGGDGAFSKAVSICQKMYRRPTSSLQPCFATVNTDPFYEMCLMGVGKEGTDLCTSVMAYLTACKDTTGGGVLLKTPSMCVKCEMNGEEMMDRDMKVISSPPPGSPPFLSTDVVFIVEAKECNRAFRMRRKIDTLAKHIEEQLQENHFKQNRYAVVLFGGDGVLEKPRIVVQAKEVFTTASNVGKHLASLPTGTNGSRDILAGIDFALQHLNFRPGASKTLILFPCSSCQPQDMTTVDYADLYYSMVEKSATLHVFLDEPFPTDNKNLAKKIFGIDTGSVFTKADAPSLQSNNNTRGLKANINSRRQVKVPKSLLGYCAPLALQTNGSIFTTKKLQNRQDNMFSTVFGDRVARTASPSACQTCYCSSAGVECFDCEYPRYESRLEEDEEDELSESDLIGPNSSSSSSGDNNLGLDDVNSDSEESEENDD
ncbi:apolipophorins isoform X2 [Folsomia candida]|nr:apolipophorins isoform X2 [Folsomia candida]